MTSEDDGRRTTTRTSVRINCFGSDAPPSSASNRPHSRVAPDPRQYYKLIMSLEHLEYDLPPELIAQHPMEPRDRSRLLVVNRSTGTIGHHVFTDLPEF